MNRSVIAILLLLTASSAFAANHTIGLGVGATSSNEITVKINGSDTKVLIEGAPSGSENGQAFLQCLIAGRVVRVERGSAGSRVTLLDGSSVGNHLAEFAQSKSASDPCELGKAAYVAHRPNTTPQVQPQPAPAPATASEKKRTLTRTPPPETATDPRERDLGVSGAAGKAPKGTAPKQPAPKTPPRSKATPPAWPPVTKT